MTVPRDELIARLDALLDPTKVADYGPNGLQVEGTAHVSKVVCGVTASQALIERTIAAGAQMLVVHHGIFWGGQSPVLRGMLRRRVKTLLDHGVTLLGYHLPLDRHEEVGNNAPALRDLGLVDLEPFAPHKGIAVGWKGRFATPLGKHELVERLGAYYEVEPRAFLGGPDVVSTLGLVSGGAQGDINTAVSDGLDAFVTGEISEYNPHVALEEGIHHVSVGHHNSERVGPRNLARWIGEHLSVVAEFIDVPNPA